MLPVLACSMDVGCPSTVFDDCAACSAACSQRFLIPPLLAGGGDESAARQSDEASFDGVKNVSKMFAIEDSVRVRLGCGVTANSKHIHLGKSAVRTFCLGKSAVGKNALKMPVRSFCFGNSAVVLGQPATGNAESGT